MTAEPDVGFVGLGLMGSPMAANLLKGGWRVTAWNRSDEALERFVGMGGSRVASVADLRDLPVIIFMLPDLVDIEREADALLNSWRTRPPQERTAVIVMSSVSPVAVQNFGRKVEEASSGRAAVLDAPVSGGTRGAKDGTLAIMIGAATRDFDRLNSLFSAMGSTVRRMGSLGAGSLAKACNQLIVGATTAALAESAELAERSGMDVEALFGVLSGGLAGSRVLELLGPRLAKKDYTPSGPAKFMNKDLSFVRAAADQTQTAIPLTNALTEIYAHLLSQGLGELDLAVVRHVIANLSETQEEIVR